MPEATSQVHLLQSQSLNFVLPPIVEEKKLSPFKFWYNNRIQDGVCYSGELFYRMQTVNFFQRARLYHNACKMSLQDVVIITTNHSHCSLWVSLRSPSARLLHRHLPPEVLESNALQ